MNFLQPNQKINLDNVGGRLACQLSPHIHALHVLQYHTYSTCVGIKMLEGKGSGLHTIHNTAGNIHTYSETPLNWTTEDISINRTLSPIPNATFVYLTTPESRTPLS